MKIWAQFSFSPSSMCLLVESLLYQDQNHWPSKISDLLLYPSLRRLQPAPPSDRPHVLLHKRTR